MKKSFLKFCFFVCIPCVLFLSGCKKEDLSSVLCQQYGLGKKLSAERSNNVKYEWYIDQATTGEHRLWNDGPSCVAMAGKWANPNFAMTPEEMRDFYPQEYPQEEWEWIGWYWFTMISALKGNNISHEVDQFVHVPYLKSILDKGHIAILDLLMYYVSRADESNPDWRIDRYYNVLQYNAQQYIIVKGYKVVDETTWFEVYDPWSQGQRYSDGTFIGCDRYYRSEEVLNAAIKANHYLWMVIVHKK